MGIHVTSKQIASQLGVTRQTLSNWVARGQFPKPISIGGVNRWPLTDVERFLNQRRIDAKLQEKG